MKLIVTGDRKALENLMKEKSFLVRLGKISIDVEEDKEKPEPVQGSEKDVPAVTEKPKYAFQKNPGGRGRPKSSGETK
jgi:hypothetical protein